MSNINGPSNRFVLELIWKCLFDSWKDVYTSAMSHKLIAGVL